MSRASLLTTKQRAKLLQLHDIEGVAKEDLMDRFGLTSTQFNSQIDRARHPHRAGTKKLRAMRRRKVITLSNSAIGAQMVDGFTQEQYAAWRKAGRPGFDGIKFNPEEISTFRNKGEQSNGSPTD